MSVMASYSVQIEVAGPLAMFARPDTGGTPTSYPVPTWSAAKGIFESIAFFSDGAAWFCPTKVEACRKKRDDFDARAAVLQGSRVQFQRYTTNYGGPLRKTSLFGKGTAPGGSSMQLFATALSGVCYRLHGEIVGPRRRGMVNPRHHLQELFNRRLQRGQCHRTPCLGWSEFTCSYWGPFRTENTEVDVDLSLDLPSMLLAVWERRVTTPADQSQYAPQFSQGNRDPTGRLEKPLRLENGVLEYPLPPEWRQEGMADAQ
ncbi:MAG TPA: CRISPR-associated protein Cas5 [Isosphaeraceae bacterium]|nr:CRISPR-associated protein Cas5 [Isosphaeraceae bacterium]